MPLRLHFFSVVLLLSFRTCSTYDVIFAINCGGGAHVDSNGISYDPDTLETGIASSHGLSLAIMRVNELDRRLYQTERYSTDSFSYKLPVPPDGDYVLVLKFSEVWFRDPGQKVFDVKINDDISLIKNLDIYASVGFATAHDERFQLKFLNGNLYVQDESTVLSVDHFTVDFKKGARDNPKINAILLLRGYLDEVPDLAPWDADEHHIDRSIEEAPTAPRSVEIDELSRRHLASGPRLPDPYESTEATSYLLPLLASIGTFLPILFCICKL